MNPVHPIDDLSSVSLPAGALHLAMGIFDGLHLGHQGVVESAVHSAWRSGGVSGVLTFLPHPSRLITPQKPTLLMMQPETKTALLHRLGIEQVLWRRFDPEFAAMEAEDFPGHLKACLPSLRAIYVGENFRFGKDRHGDVDLMSRLMKPLEVNVYSVSRIRFNERRISSSRVREAISEGRIEDANQMLGYTYFAEGEVQAGKQMGRKLNFPTINLPWNPELRPHFGVYAVRLCCADGRSLPGVANYGLRPTFGDLTEPVIETHLFDSVDVSPGDEISVDWFTFIRPEQKFDGPDALREQIAKDVTAAQEWFERNPWREPAEGPLTRRHG